MPSPPLVHLCPLRRHTPNQSCLPSPASPFAVHAASLLVTSPSALVQVRSPARLSTAAPGRPPRPLSPPRSHLPPAHPRRSPLPSARRCGPPLSDYFPPPLVHPPVRSPSPRPAPSPPRVPNPRAPSVPAHSAAICAPRARHHLTWHILPCILVQESHQGQQVQESISSIVDRSFCYKVEGALSTGQPL
ncbi:unnamed protein product [Closterium sp. NIES-54]